MSVTICHSHSSTETAEELKVNLEDCEELLRNGVVGPPGESHLASNFHNKLLREKLKDKC